METQSSYALTSKSSALKSSITPKEGWHLRLDILLALAQKDQSCSSKEKLAKQRLRNAVLSGYS